VTKDRALVPSLLLLAATVFPANAETLGQRYHTREPHTCASMKAPSRGALSAAQAVQHTTCLMEGERSHQLILVGDVHVEVGGGTRYNDLASTHRPGSAAPNAMIYDIRGSYKRYACEASPPAGQNCRVLEHPHAEGRCYITKFGDWACSMADNNVGYGTANQPPPAN
jgi:hypothetical protein